MRRFPVLTWLLALALLPGSLGACRKVDEKAGGAKPGAAGGRAAARPQAEGTLTGKIVETMDSGGYTYLRLTTDQGERWAAVRQAPVQVGDQVTVTDAALMKNFASKTLNRTFPEIWFGALGGLGGAGPGGKKGGMMPPGHPPVGGATEGTADEAREAHAKAGASKVALEGPVAKAPGPEGRTVAEVHAQAKALDGKPVAVRGRVVKWNANILGKNWLHLQDGSGAEAGKDFDLTVTTQGTAAKGDVVLVKGTLRTNKDFGAGYVYNVIVEEATLEK